MQVTQVTVEPYMCGRLVHVFLGTPLSGVWLTPEDCFPPLAQSSVDVC